MKSTLIIILLLLFSISSAFAAGTKNKKQLTDRITPFGDIEWSDNIVDVISKLNKMGCEKVTAQFVSERDLSSYTNENIDFSGLTGKQVVDKLDGIKNIIESAKDSSYLIDIYAETLSIKQMPFSAHVSMRYNMGYVLSYVDKQIEIGLKDTSGNPVLVPYAIEYVTITKVQGGGDNQSAYNSIIKLLDVKYEKHRKSNKKIVKEVKNRYAKYLQLNPGKIVTQDMINTSTKDELNHLNYRDKFGTEIVTDMDKMTFTYNAKESFINYLTETYAEYKKEREITEQKQRLKGKEDIGSRL